MAFKVGDMAVYPAHGVGVVEGIETVDLAGTQQAVYVLKLLGSSSTVKVPTSAAESNGMRPIISREEVDEIFFILREHEVDLDKQTWNRRYREYQAKIRTGSPFEVARVLRDLHVLRGDKSLSFGERKTFDQAMGLLVREVAIALGRPEEELSVEINEIFK